MRAGLLSIVLNIIFNMIFTKFMGYQGLALSMSVVAFFYTAIVFVMLAKQINHFHYGYLVKETGKILFSFRTCCDRHVLLKGHRIFEFITCYLTIWYCLYCRWFSILNVDAIMQSRRCYAFS